MKRGIKRQPYLFRIASVVGVLLLLSGLLWWKTFHSTLHLTAEEKEWLRNHPTIRIAPNPNFIPIEFYEGDTLYSGVAADLIKEIEQLVGIKFTVVRFNNMAEIFEAAQRKEIDIITATAITEQRKAYLSFTEPFIHLQKVIVVRKNDKRSLTIDSLRGMKVAIIYHSSVHERILKEGIKAILDTVPSTLESLYEVSFGKVDASVANIATVSYIIERRGLSNLRIAGDFGPKDPYTMAVRRDLPVLYNILNKALAAIPEPKRRSIVKKWTGLELEVPWYDKLPWQYITIALFAVILFVIIILLWNRTLRKRLEKNRIDLEREFQKRLMAQNALVKSEEKFHTLFYASADANLLILDGVFVDCNDAALRSLDAERDYLIGKRLDEISPALQPDGSSSREKYEQLLSAALEHGSIKFEWVQKKQSGHNVWVEVSLTRVIIENKTALYTTWRDITDRKLVEQETYRHFTQIQTLYNASQKIVQSLTTYDVARKTIEALDTLFTWQRNSLWLYHPEKEMLELLVYSKGEQSEEEYQKELTRLQKNFSNANDGICGWVVKHGTPLLLNSVQADSRYRSDDPTVAAELCVPLIVGSRVIGCINIESPEEHAFSEHDLHVLTTLASSIAVVFENVRLIESLRNELEERTRIETQRQKLEEQLRHVQKMESLGTLAGGIAHDFNNLLGIISAYTEMLAIHKHDEARFHKYFEVLAQTITRATELVQQILTFARRTEIQKVPVNINTLVQEIVKFLNETFPKTIEIKTDLQSHLSSIMGDPTQIHQALMNLAVNARDAMPNGGILSLKTELVSTAVVQQVFPKAQASAYVAITIRDTGVGMPQEVLQRIYEPFFTTKEKGKGTGLGLSVVYGIVSSLDGFIDVKSSVGKGTTFTIYLPSNEQPQMHERPAETPAHVKGGNETIFLIEDEDFLRELVQSILESHGYKVLTARDGLEAVELFKKENANIDLILSDLGLPKMSGSECLVIIKRIKPLQRVIMASGYFDPEERRKLSELGVSHFFQKPYNPSHLLKTIREVLDVDSEVPVT